MPRNHTNKGSHDEYYTKYEHVANIIETYFKPDYFKDKIVYMPCDSDQSNFVKYFKDNKDILQYKELVYTSDDFNTHSDLFEYADVIITNPPFSKIVKQFIPMLNKCKKDFFIFGSRKLMGHYYFHFVNKTVKFISPNKYFRFDTPEGDPNKEIVFIYITNIDVKQLDYNKQIFNNKRTDLAYYKQKTINDYPRISYIDPQDKETFLAPCTILLEQNRRYFDIDEKLNNDIENRSVKYDDGKWRYVRIFAKWKNISL